MPDLATTGSDIRIVRWMIGVGQPVKRGQPLVEIETDKATMEVESTVDGVLRSIESSAEEKVSVGQVIATLDVVEPTSAPSADPSPAPKRTGMFARNRAAASPSSAGPAATAPPPPGETPLMSIAQRTAARRLQESKQTIPHFYLQTCFNAEPLVAHRKAAEPGKLVWDAFFVHAIGKVLKHFERMTYRIEGDRLVPASSDSIGVAVDAGGDLFVIAIPSPADRSIREISDDIREQAARLRRGDPEARRLPRVAMTISNLGSCNVESFIPIINPPEAAILGIGKIAPTCVARDERVVVEHRATLTLAVDHRIVNGKYAGDFLTAIVGELESSR